MAVTVQVDWAKNSVWTDVGDDVSTRVRPRANPVTASYGRPESTALGPVTSGRGSLTLDNTSRDYTPRNTSSPLYGKLKPARPVRIQRTVGSTTYTLLVGHTDTAPINPDVDAKTVSLALVDSLADFRGVTVSTGLVQGCRTGAAIGYILDAAGWTGGRDLDRGGTVMPWWWEEGTDALQALQNIIAAEGPPALLTIGSSGEIVFRDRHHRLVRSGSTTSQATFRGIGAEPVMNVGFGYDEAWQNVVNTASIAVPVRVQGAQAVVWSSDDVLVLSPGELVEVKVSTSDPFAAAQLPDITTTAGSATVISSLNRRSGASVTMQLVAYGTARITRIALRANPVTVARTQTVTATDGVSVTDYGPRAMPDIPFAGVADVKAIVSTTFAQRSQPLPVLTVKFQVGGTSASQLTRAAAVLKLNLSDRVTVIEPETGLSDDFYVESISHSLTGDEDHTVTLGLEACPTQVTNVLVLGSATRGVLGTNRLGKSGLDDPSTVFVLGTGVLGTNILAR